VLEVSTDPVQQVLFTAACEERTRTIREALARGAWIPEESVIPLAPAPGACRVERWRGAWC